MNKEDRYHVRDKETLKIKNKFRILRSAQTYLDSLNFLKKYYEIYDSLTNSICLPSSHVYISIKERKNEE